MELTRAPKERTVTLKTELENSSTEIILKTDLHLRVKWLHKEQKRNPEFF
jgi:hypothetical protein